MVSPLAGLQEHLHPPSPPRRQDATNRCRDYHLLRLQYLPGLTRSTPQDHMANNLRRRIGRRISFHSRHRRVRLSMTTHTMRAPYPHCQDHRGDKACSRRPKRSEHRTRCSCLNYNPLSLTRDYSAHTLTRSYRLCLPLHHLAKRTRTPRRRSAMSFTSTPAQTAPIRIHQPL